VNRRYKSYIDGVGTNGGNRYLPTAQGFIVRAENNTPVLTARETIKVSNQVALQRTESLVNSIIRLQVSRGNMSDEVVIANRPNTQLAFEPQADAQKMINPATNVFIGGIISQSIASMDLNAVNEIPIVLLSDSSGMVSLNTTEFTNITEGPYYLVDEITTEVYPYTPETRYNFFLNANEPYSLTLRMNNVTQSKNFIKNQFEVFPNPATDKITIKTKGIGEIEILNIVGKVLITQPATETNEINIAKLVKGVYTIKFNGISQKLVVR
ncbi:MAG: T9SS type A sorting domain-containing protein, partial [Flexibacteraceae bacterium]